MVFNFFTVVTPAGRVRLGGSLGKGPLGVFPSAQPRSTQVRLEAPSPITMVVLFVIGVVLILSSGFWVWIGWGEFWFIPAVFGGLMGVIGLVVLGIAGAMYLARRKVEVPELVVSAQPLYLGESFTVQVRQRFKGACQLQKGTLALVCREEARYRRGTNTYTVRKEVYQDQREIFSAQQVHPGAELREEVRFQVPEDAMHSFQAQWNEIQWYLELHLALAGWPDYRGEFPLQVAPHRAESTSA